MSVLISASHFDLQRENLADKVDDSDGSEELLAQIKLNLSEVSLFSVRIDRTTVTKCGMPLCVWQLDAKVVQKQRAIGDLRTKKVRHDDELNRKSKDKGRLEEAAKHLDNIARQFADKVLLRLHGRASMPPPSIGHSIFVEYTHFVVSYRVCLVRIQSSLSGSQFLSNFPLDCKRMSCCHHDAGERGFHSVRHRIPHRACHCGDFHPTAR